MEQRFSGQERHFEQGREEEISSNWANVVNSINTPGHIGRDRDGILDWSPRLTVQWNLLDASERNARGEAPSSSFQ